MQGNGFATRRANGRYVRVALCASTVLAGLMISPPAAALAQAAGATGSPVRNVDAAAGATGEVIVFTARKREGAALDVPMSISVLSGDRRVNLGVRHLRDIGNL